MPKVAHTTGWQRVPLHTAWGQGSWVWEAPRMADENPHGAALPDYKLASGPPRRGTESWGSVLKRFGTSAYGPLVRTKPAPGPSARSRAECAGHAGRTRPCAASPPQPHGPGANPQLGLHLSGRQQGGVRRVIEAGLPSPYVILYTLVTVTSN